MAIGWFYPYPNLAEDGYVGESYGLGSGKDWSTLVTGSGNLAADASASAYACVFQADNSVDKWRFCYRGLILFDTTNILGTAYLAKIYLHGSAKADLLNLAPSVNIYGAPGIDNPGGLQNADFGDIYPANTAFSTAISYDDWSTTGYNEFVLNSAGRDNIQAGGLSYFSIKNMNYDIAEVAPQYPDPYTTNQSHIQFYTVDKGVDYRPKLYVEYSDTPTDRQIWVSGLDFCYGDPDGVYRKIQGVLSSGGGVTTGKIGYKPSISERFRYGDTNNYGREFHGTDTGEDITVGRIGISEDGVKFRWGSSQGHKMERQGYLG